MLPKPRPCKRLRRPSAIQANAIAGWYSIHIIAAALLMEGIEMATYLELRAKGEKLLAEAEEMRIKELNDVIQDIKEKVKTYGLSAHDLGFSAGGGSRRKRSSGPAVKAAPKYRSLNGETWSGGRGRKPRWVTEALAAGKKLEQFAI